MLVLAPLFLQTKSNKQQTLAFPLWLVGINEKLAPHFEGSQIPFIPGIATPSEIILGKQLGWDTFKFFPAHLFGGIKSLKTYGQVFPDVKFCPTGGINEETYPSYLELQNVISVGGSWVI